MEKQNQNSKQLLEDINKIVNEADLPSFNTKQGLDYVNDRREGERRGSGRKLTPAEVEEIKKKYTNKRKAEAERRQNGERRVVDRNDAVLKRVGGGGPTAGQMNARASISNKFDSVREAVNRIVNETGPSSEESFNNLTRKIAERGRDEKERNKIPPSLAKRTRTNLQRKYDDEELSDRIKR